MSKKLEPTKEFTNVPLRLEKGQAEKISAAAEKTGMSQQAIMRMSIERGFEVLMKALGEDAAA